LPVRAPVPVPAVGPSQRHEAQIQGAARGGVAMHHSRRPPEDPPLWAPRLVRMLESRWGRTAVQPRTRASHSRLRSSLGFFVAGAGSLWWVCVPGFWIPQVTDHSLTDHLIGCSGQVDQISSPDCLQLPCVLKGSSALCWPMPKI
jgi:hypothetical protein